MIAAEQNGSVSMNAIELKFSPGVRGLYALASRAPGTYKGGRPAGCYVVWHSGRAAF